MTRLNAHSTRRNTLHRNRFKTCVEMLESRLVLSTSSLSQYVYSAGALANFPISGATHYDENYSGVAIYRQGSSDRMLIAVNRRDTAPDNPPALVEFNVTANFAPTGAQRRRILLSGFDDVEAVVSLGGTEVAIVEERLAHISRFSIPEGAADITITKGEPGITTITPTPGLNRLTNDNMEGLAYIPPSEAPGFSQGLFILGRESSTQSIYRVNAANGAQVSIPVSNLASTVADISDIVYRGGDLYVSTEAGSNDKVIRIQLNDLTGSTPTGTIATDQVPASGALNLSQIEGLTFSPDGARLIVVGEKTASVAAAEYAVYNLVLPSVTQVTVGTTGTHADYPIPVGSGEQIRTVPVGGVNEIMIKFDRNVAIDGPELAVVSRRASPATDLAISSSFSYDNTTFTAKWTLAAPIVSDQVEIQLDADSVFDAASPLVKLDGDWTNPIRLVAAGGDPVADTFPSGNGTAGEDFVFYVTVMPDFNRDMIADFTDLGIILNNYDMSGMTHAQGDITGDGNVGFEDLGILLNVYDQSWASWPGFALRATESPGTLSRGELEALGRRILKLFRNSPEEFTEKAVDELIADALSQGNS
jgi:uncharacterized protein YjiK